MKILRGIVISNFDALATGVLTVKHHSRLESHYKVIYTSPYFSRNESGIVAIPEVGSEILFVFDPDFNEYYYISTLVTPGTLFDQNRDPEFNTTRPLINEKKLYGDNGIPQAIIFKDTKGAGLKVSNYYDKAGISARVELKTSTNHKLLLSDSPKMDCVILRNKDLDGITITSRKNDVHSANSIETKSKGAQRCIVRESEYTVVVADGRDITLYNNSTGAFKNPDQPNQYGNINLISKNKDINVWSEGDGGKVFVSTKNGLIQINSGGNVVIHSAASVTIKSDQDINLKADGNINMEGQAVNIHARGDTQIKADRTARLQGDTSTNIGRTGTPLQLNPPTPSITTMPTLDIPNPEPNAYNK